MAEADPNSTKPVPIKFQKKVLLGLLLIIVVAAISYAFFNRSDKQNTKGQIYSIAVMPFKNLSDDKTNQYFADGVMDDIMNNLSTIKEFKVISEPPWNNIEKLKKQHRKLQKNLK